VTQRQRRLHRPQDLRRVYSGFGHLASKPLARTQPATKWQPMVQGQRFSDGQEADMAYERLNEALRQLKEDRERAEAIENERKKRSQKPKFGSRKSSPG
jgi:hypothetical protein